MHVQLLPLALPAPPTPGYGAADLLHPTTANGLLHSTTANGGIGMPPICFSTARVSGIAIIHSRWNSPLALSAVTCERNGIQRSASLIVKDDEQQVFFDSSRNTKSFYRDSHGTRPNEEKPSSQTRLARLVVVVGNGRP
ncbi:hypothetical protein HAX54_043091 [Datura stramonium]|uniref:Uncharacterized protein n=1 Tax=Datura stramonium TaxID=4076 RepID=A0ABS8W1W6_DATST|nr:hypothetical protein [Datura stramonium]